MYEAPMVYQTFLPMSLLYLFYFFIIFILFFMSLL